METPVFELKRGKPLDLDEAKRVSQLLFRITQRVSQRVSYLAQQLELAAEGEDGRYSHIESLLESEVLAWEGKVERLGGIPRGLWMADFDSGTGYFCWKFPEVEVSHWHGYREGFSNRVCIDGQEQESSENVMDAQQLLGAQEMK